MKNLNLYDFFIKELRNILNCERQIIEFLPVIMKTVSLQDLKETFSKSLKETENQENRIEKILSILGMSVTDEETCVPVEQMIAEVRELTNEITKSLILDAVIVAAAQKIKHYEIACYGTLKNCAKHLEFNSEIIDLLQDSLEEKCAMDKKLMRIAEGSFVFTHNLEERPLVAGSKSKR